MSDATDQALQAAVKALAEVVSPAVDSADALAVEQLRLVISWLQFHGLRRPDERRLAWAVLRQRIALARDAAAALHGTALQADVQARTDTAQSLLARADARSDDWRHAAEALDGAIGAAFDALAGGPAAARDALARVVLRHAEDGLMLHRAWFAPFGFEARPDAVPPLERLLAGAPPG